MAKPGLLLLLALAFPASAAAQMPPFPIGFGGVPTAKLKGKVHTVLTIEQRGERVFGTVVEVYDTDGRLVETLSSNAGVEIHSDSMVRLGGKSIYFHDADGRPARRNDFTPDGRYTGYEVYAYDARGRLTGTLLYDDRGKETGKRTYTYFPERREVLATWSFYYDGRIPAPSKNLIAYNEGGQWTKRTEYGPGGEVSASVTFEYDARGNFVRDVHCCQYNYSHSYEYEFDRQGNWVERRDTQSQPGRKGDEETRPGWMHTYRVITYYSDRVPPPPR